MEITGKTKITSRQKAIIIGSLLGDGYLDKNPYESICLEIKQRSDHRDYVFWLWKELKALCNRQPYQRADNHQWRLLTRYSKELKFYHNFFYNNRKKVIRKDIVKILRHPLSLAIWYMDDGTLDFRPHNHYAYFLATYCFSETEQKILVNALYKNFGIEATIQKTKMRDKQQYRLYIGKNSRNNFRTLIQPYIVKSFRYKLP
jgi:hypothetical protein